MAYEAFMTVYKLLMGTRRDANVFVLSTECKWPTMYVSTSRQIDRTLTGLLGH